MLCESVGEGGLSVVNSEEIDIAPPRGVSEYFIISTKKIVIYFWCGKIPGLPELSSAVVESVHVSPVAKKAVDDGKHHLQ